MKRYEQENLESKVFNWGLLTVLEGEPMTIMTGTMEAGRKAGMVLEQVVKTSILYTNWRESDREKSRQVVLIQTTTSIIFGS